MSPMHPLEKSSTYVTAWPAVAGATADQAQALARTFASLAGDVALVIDEAGLILGAAQGDVPLGQGPVPTWIGRAWADAVSPESRGKVALMLRELSEAGQARRREINHRADDGHALALACTAVRLGEHGPSLVVGRDLCAISALQQRLLQAQQQLEAGYWEARQDLAYANPN